MYVITFEHDGQAHMLGPIHWRWVARLWHWLMSGYEHTTLYKTEEE